jgi:transcriptional regulator with XRE-family HTH domain
MDLGSAIKVLRKKKRLGQKELSEMCNLSVNALSQIETNSSFPHKSTIIKLCEALDVPVSYLLFFSISDEDVPEDKRSVFNSLNGAIRSMLLDSVVDD